MRAAEAGVLHAAPRARAGAVAEHVVVDPDHAGLEPARRCARPWRGSCVQTEAPRPNSESFASAIASSSSSTVTIGTTGPKISSRMIRMSCVTPVSTAGVKKRLGLGGPPQCSVAPFATASSTSSLHGLELLARDHRPDLGLPVERVAHAQRLRALDHALDEAVGHLLHHVHALDARAGLPGVGEAAPEAAGDRVRQVGVGAHDHRVLAAQLEHRALHPLGALHAHAAPDLDRAGEEDLRRARLDQRLADRAAAVHGAHEALGQRRRARTPPGCAGRSAA